MKTINNQPLRICEERLSLLLSWFRLPLELGAFTLVKKKLSDLGAKLLAIRHLRARAVQDRVVTLVKALILASTVNSRVYVGLLLAAVSYPLCSCSHMFFSREVVNKGWYYEHYADLFLVIGPYLSVFLCTLGVYLLQSYKDHRVKALFIPMGLSMGKVLWLLQVQSNEEFWSLPSISFVFYGLLIGSLLPMVLDWTIWRKFHDFDAKMARPIGLVNVIPMSEVDRKILKSEIEKAKSFSF